MDKKRAFMVNAVVIAALLLLTLALLIASKATQRRIVPNAGPLDFEFEPAVTTEAPSAHDGGWMMIDDGEDLHS